MTTPAPRRSAIATPQQHDAITSTDGPRLIIADLDSGTTMLDLELIITRTGAHTTAVLRVERTSRRADLADDVPLILDAEALRALSLIPNAYGAALTEMVFVPPLREAWQRALGYAEGQDAPLRVRLHLRGDDALHAIRWELLRDPVTHTPLAHRERVAFSRFLSSNHLGDLHAATRPSLRAVVAVADAAGPGMAPVDVAGEVSRAQTGLGDVPVTVLDGRDGRPAATLAHLADAMRSGPHVLALTCHGALVEGQPYLYLAGDDPYRPTPGAELIRQLADLRQRPLLVILAACQSGGDGDAALAALGPQLARIGIGAVIAMQGDVPMDLVAALMPRLFSELRRDGQIDRAVAAARAALPTDQPWWLPVLWMAVRDGALWRTPEAPASPVAPSSIHFSGNVGTVQHVTVSGGNVGSIIGSQVTYGAAPPPAGGKANAIAAQRQLLDAHRATLAHSLHQLAITGSAHARPEIPHGITEARAGIARAKHALAALGAPAADHPDDTL